MMHICTVEKRSSQCVLVQFSNNKVSLIRYDGEFSGVTLSYGRASPQVRQRAVLMLIHRPCRDPTVLLAVWTLPAASCRQQMWNPIMLKLRISVWQWQPLYIQFLMHHSSYRDCGELKACNVCALLTIHETQWRHWRHCRHTPPCWRYTSCEQKQS